MAAAPRRRGAGRRFRAQPEGGGGRSVRSGGARTRPQGSLGSPPGAAAPSSRPAEEPQPCPRGCQGSAAAMDEEPERTKRWEGGYERTWWVRELPPFPCPALPCSAPGSAGEASLVLRQRLFPCREILKEDESGSLKATIEDILFKAKRKRYSAFGLAPSAGVTVPGKGEEIVSDVW